MSGRDARFTVVPNKATYVGSFRIDFQPPPAQEGIVFRRIAFRVAVRVTNEFDKALQQYKERNPRAPYEVTTSLMTIGK